MTNELQRVDLYRRISNTNWNRVYYFSLVATLSSVRAASEAIGLSPSTLSEHVSSLEKDLEVALFKRENRKMLLTEAGQKLFVHAKSMFEDGQRLLDVVSPVRLGFYPMTIGIVSGVHENEVNRVLSSFVRQNEPMDMRIEHRNSGDLQKALLESKFDIGFSSRFLEHRDLKCKLILKSPLGLFVSKKWADRKQTEILKELPLLICKPAEEDEKTIEQIVHGIGCLPASTIYTDSVAMLIEFCRQGLGVGVLAKSLASDSDLHELKIQKLKTRIESKLYAVWLAEAENTKTVTLFKNFIRIWIKNPRGERS